MPSSRFARSEYVLVPWTGWAICSRLSPSAMVSGDCSKVRTYFCHLYVRKVRAGRVESWHWKSLKLPVQDLLEIISKFSGCSHQKTWQWVSGDSQEIFIRWNIYISIFYISIFSKKHPSKTRLSFHVGLDQTQTAFILCMCYKVCKNLKTQYCSKKPLQQQA